MTEEVKDAVDQPVRSPDIELDKKTKKHDADNADLEADLKPWTVVDLDEAELFLQQHDALLTTAYGIPYGACTALFMSTGPWVASKLKNFRTIIMMPWLLPTLIAVCLF
ncbi:hypothetical protein F4809DRAFT_603217 [Biscogniauxia mediterranea]|nr:hypothetical protein F4809DRAFT_603217 [Biscogniauxia mediterranea]